MYRDRNRNGKKISGSGCFDNLSLIYILLQGVLYVTFLFLDLTGTRAQLSNDIKFTVIILCFCYVLFFQKGADKSILFYLRTALFFTVISDLCLLLLDYNLPGVCSFIIVQQLYGLKLDYEGEPGRSPGKRFLVFITRLAVQAILTALVCVVLKALGVAMELLLVITVFYFLSIMTNVVRAIINGIRHKDMKGSRIFVIGMVLFLLCDINVGLFNMADYLSLPQALYHQLYTLSSVLMWTFYAPSQLLISLSSGRKTA